MSRSFNDLIAAYCVGCLDSESLRELNDHIRSGGDLNFQELGEFQNLIALLPSTLYFEQPGPDVKDKVARKLYKMKDEVLKIRKSISQKEQKKEPEQQAYQDEKKTYHEREQELYRTTEPDETNQEPEPEIREEQESLTDREQIEEKVHVLKPRRTAEYLRPSHETQIKGRTSGNLYTPYNLDKERKEEQRQEPAQEPEVHITNTDDEFISLPDEHVANIFTQEGDIEDFHEREEHIPAKKNYTLIISGLLVAILVVIGIVYAYMKLTSDVQDYKNEVEKLNKRINSLTMQLSSSREIQSMLNSPNIQIINLQGTEINTTGFGKLIISADKGSGYLQLANMPHLPENMVYQLWLNLSGSLISLGTFKPEDSMGYYSFKMPDIPVGYSTKFLVTGEPETGSKKPGYKIYLTGSL